MGNNNNNTKHTGGAKGLMSLIAFIAVFLILGVVADNPGVSQQEIVKYVGVDKSIVSVSLHFAC